jgi:hypothetical protein
MTIGQDTLLEYINFKRGIPKNVAKSVIEDLSDYVLLKLAQGDKVSIPDLGSFTTIPNPYYGARVKYRPSERVKRTVRNEAKREETCQDLIQEFQIEDKDEEDRAPELSPKELGKNSKNGENIIRSSFLDYLRDDFAFGKDWVHPTSKVVVSHELIKDKLLQYKKQQPENHLLLWSLVTNQQTREIISLHRRLSTSSVQRRWNKAISNILTACLFPELEPDTQLEVFE